MFHNPSARFADDARGVSLVHHHQQAVFFAQGHEIRQRRDVAVHAEHRVADDNAEGRSRRFDFRR